MKKVGLFYGHLQYVNYGHLVYFKAMWQFSGNLVYFSRLGIFPLGLVY
jgi:hypothetical protein